MRIKLHTLSIYKKTRTGVGRSRVAPVIGEALGFEFKARQGVRRGDLDGGAQAQPVGEGAFYLVGGVVGITVEF